MRELKDYKNRPTIGRGVLAICLMAEGLILATVVLVGLQVEGWYSILLDGAAWVLIVMGLYYSLFRRTGGNVDTAIQQRLYAKLSKGGSLSKKLALVNLHDDQVRRTFGTAMVSGGVTWLLSSVLGHAPISLQLLYVSLVFGGNLYMLLRLWRIERKMR